MRNLGKTLAVAAALSAAGCTATSANLAGDPTIPVFATAETLPVATINEDAADDPAIWLNPQDGAASLVVGTDKKGGLYVYDLSGTVRDFVPEEALNNVDLVDMGDAGVFVVASDRSDIANAHVMLYRLDTAAAKLERLARIPTGPGEGYGICARRDGDAMRVYTAPKEGLISDWRVSLGANPEAMLVRKMTVPSQPEGCAADPRDGTLYIGEEAGGIWRFAPGSTTGELVVPVDNAMLVADLEGLAIVPEGASGGWLFASSQGDNTYMRFRLPDLQPAGRFRIAAGMLGSVEETDGIEAVKGDFGPAFPGGLFVAQDGVNGENAQNFKFVPLGLIESALDLGAAQAAR